MDKKLYTITEMAQELGLAVSTARYYRDRFKYFVPAIKKGSKKLYDKEALEALRIISEGLRGGEEAARVEEQLNALFSVTIDQEDNTALTPAGPVYGREEWQKELESRQQLAQSMQALVKQLEYQNKAIFSLIESRQEPEDLQELKRELAAIKEKLNKKPWWKRLKGN